jgi:protoporphyrinogen oxidase
MKKVLIIGAGPAGLTAAYELLDKSKDYEVTVLEESGVFGGISRTVKHAALFENGHFIILAFVE